MDQYEGDISYNIAPGSYVWVINREGAVNYKWGLVPGWMKDGSKSYNLSNLRDDTLTVKRKFQGNYRKRRCLIPVSGFYEWKREGDKKIPHFFYRSEKMDFCLAGLWDTCEQQGSVLNTFTIITTDANSLMAPIHHRMPVIVEDYERWLNSGSVDDILKPASDDFLSCHRVSAYVNKTRNQGIKCIEEIHSEIDW